MGGSQSKARYPKGHVDGLAEALGNAKVPRERILNTGTLLQWPSPKTVGVIGSKALRKNKCVMLAVASVLCPQSKERLGLTVQPLKKEACMTNKSC